jgi:hypothetical protein
MDRFPSGKAFPGNPVQVLHSHPSIPAMDESKKLNINHHSSMSNCELSINLLMDE